eukprot:4068832-Prymnesium_polylepis.1
MMLQACQLASRLLREQVRLGHLDPEPGLYLTDERLGTFATALNGVDTSLACRRRRPRHASSSSAATRSRWPCARRRLEAAATTVNPPPPLQWPTPRYTAAAWLHACPQVSSLSYDASLANGEGYVGFRVSSLDACLEDVDSLRLRHALSQAPPGAVVPTYAPEIDALCPALSTVGAWALEPTFRGVLPPPGDATCERLQHTPRVQHTPHE